MIDLNLEKNNKNHKINIYFDVNKFVKRSGKLNLTIWFCNSAWQTPLQPVANFSVNKYIIKTVVLK